MAHEITSTDKFGEVRVGGKRAWHGLGEEIAEGMGAGDAAKEVGVDWTTHLEPILCAGAEIPSHRMHMRDDNNAHLGIVGAGYQIFENADVCEFADALVGLDSAISVETIGTLQGGKKFFVLVKLPRMIQAASNDPLAQYVLLSNGHGGVASFNAYPTSIRVVCANTLRWSERDVIKGCRFQHTGDLESKLEGVKMALGIAMRETDKFEEQVMALSSTKLSVASMSEYFETVHDMTEGKLTDNEDRRARVLQTWADNMDDERQLGGGSVWTAYNAISQYYDHDRGRMKSLDESTSRAHSNIFGLSSNMKMKAYNAALELV